MGRKCLTLDKSLFIQTAPLIGKEMLVEAHNLIDEMARYCYINKIRKHLL